MKRIKLDHPKSLSLLLLYILLSLLFCSCGSKKKALQVETTKKDISTHENKDMIANVLISTLEDNTTYTPIDNTKPMITPDGKTTVNAKVEIINKKKEETVKIVDKGEIKKDESIKEKKKVLDVETKKPNPWLWIGLFAFLAISVYFLIKKFRIF